MSASTGLAVMRLQPLHTGHTAVINRMIQENEVVIVGLGSAQLSNTRWDPYEVNIRIQMIKNIYEDRIKVVPLNDIDSKKGTSVWVDYVLERIKKLGLPEPNRYYTGSIADASWYRDVFFLGEKGDLFRKKLVLLDRTKNNFLSASEIRMLLETQDISWKKGVPEVNWDLVRNKFPAEFIINKSEI